MVEPLPWGTLWDVPEPGYSPPYYLYCTRKMGNWGWLASAMEGGGASAMVVEKI